jgi:hypothetical protein
MQLGGIYNDEECVLIIGGVSQGDVTELNLGYDTITVSESINALIVEGLFGGACVTLDNRSEEANHVRHMIDAESVSEADVEYYLDTVILSRLEVEALIDLLHKSEAEAIEIGYTKCLSDVNSKLEELEG